MALWFAAVGLVAACGEDKNYGAPIDNPQAAAQAKAAVDAAASLSTMENQPTDSTAVAKMGQLYSAMSVLLNAKLANQTGSLAPALALEVLRSATTLEKPWDAACVTVTAGKVSYANCDLSGVGSINGTVSWGGGTFSVNLTMSLQSGGATFNVVERGSVTVTATAITGGLDITARGTVSGYSFDYGIHADYAVTLAARQATAGYIEVHGEWTVRGPQSGSYDVWVKAVFDGSTVTIY